MISWVPEYAKQVCNRKNGYVSNTCGMISDKPIVGKECFWYFRIHTLGSFGSAIGLTGHGLKRLESTGGQKTVATMDGVMNGRRANYYFTILMEVQYTWLVLVV